jgi:hypothetical protein
MNKTVTVTGMEVRTKVGSNLLISHSATAGTDKNADSTFTTSDSTAIKAWLEPVSTNNAAANNFWYTVNAKADGSKDSGDYLDYDAVGLVAEAESLTYANAFSKTYGVTKSEVTGFGATTTPNNAAVGYVDYAFQLKATNTEGGAATINLTQLDLTYDKDATGQERNGEVAFRAAVFVEPLNAAGTAYANAGGTTLNAVYKPSTAAYFDGANGGVSAAGTRTAVSNLVTDTAVPLATLSDGATGYYKVVVRLWLEGEDTTCTSQTFANLTDTWSLDLELQLGQGTPVTAMNMVAGYTAPASP